MVCARGPRHAQLPSLAFGIPQVRLFRVAKETYRDRVGSLKVEPIAKKKDQKRKSKALGEGPSAKKGTPLRNKPGTGQENSEGDRCKRERTATLL
ncbi:hypothetical protein NDU88_006438 [Pleurodeles waltl]|uniref:Uncharacterized protein n=1 Tax=Pleurodeles waltl TaxID=8319 RepID=A0AAV7TDH3_PLEWA|nr:hypothetical protein NDU88_006438 [Pleurodeles waltl]